MDRARDAYRGESKTDARDARVISEQARMRPDLGELTPGEEDLAELQLFLARRRDLVTDQTRTITRLRETLLSLFPALERTLDLNNKGALTLVAHYPRLRKGNKGLKRVFYQSAFASFLRGSPHSRAFYDRKRREGKKHTPQALIALARRRGVNVLWAMLRDETTFKVPPAA